MRFDEDPQVLEKLYQHFDYLLDLPCELRGTRLDEAEHLATLEADYFLGFVLGYPIEDCQVQRSHFRQLAPEDNLAIRHYRLLKPVMAWPRPIVGITSESGQARVSGTHKVNVLMQSIGCAQMWWGGDVAMLFEAVMEGDVYNRDDFGEMLHRFWECCEDFLVQQGVQRIYTDGRDPQFEDRWYADFLSRRGYTEVEQGKITVIKIID